MNYIFGKLLRKMPYNCTVLAVALIAMAVPVSSSDDDERRHDHDIALKALLRGEILPLEKILVEVRKAAPGEIVDVELGRYHKSWVYRFKILTPQAQLITVVAQAKTGVVIKIKLGAELEDDD